MQACNWALSISCQISPVSSLFSTPAITMLILCHLCMQMRQGTLGRVPALSCSLSPGNEVLTFYFSLTQKHTSCNYRALPRAANAPLIISKIERLTFMFCYPRLLYVIISVQYFCMMCCERTEYFLYIINMCVTYFISYQSHIYNQ